MCIRDRPNPINPLAAVTAAPSFVAAQPAAGIAKGNAIIVAPLEVAAVVDSPSSF